ncbi:glycosyltransferase family 2 protein [Helicobacter canis]|uniref:Glycosyl transferase family protein n=1 Tax=Helicobacter canis TaxID=29419 RepID=A0A377J4T0_9HELI|nr:glycosyltransferase family 2 protein [Helicobacter canis]STO97507.1 glycosyl transferase family protein [Helicobacter canis]
MCQHGVAIHKPESTFSKVDSRNALFANAKSMDCHADKSARNDSELDSSVDCHATASAVSRNDNEKVDSRSFAKNAKNLTTLQAEARLDSSKSPSDSKILELESGLLLKKPASASPCTASLVFKPHKEIRLECLLTQCGDEIHDSSPKAESLLKLPKISLITTTFNSATTISSTLESILAQSYTDFEHIIIDNQSSDSTLSIIESYRPQYRAKGVSLQVFSQRDLGIYDGMNKGLEKARGEIVGFLNADDFFASKLVLEFIAWGFDKPDSIDIVYANILYISHSMQPLRTLNGKNLKKLDFALGFHPPHPSFYAKKALYTRYGGFDLSYAIAADYEIMLRFLQKYQAKSLYIDECFVKMRVGGTSNANLSNIMRANFECARAWRDNGLSSFPIFIVLKPLRKILHRLVMLLGGGGES